MAEPTAKAIESLNAFFVSAVVPPTYPITKGIVDKLHGVIEVNIPAISAMIGDIQKLFEIIIANKSIHYFSALFL